MATQYEQIDKYTKLLQSGKISIRDRRKLYKILKQANRHRFVLIDVLLDIEDLYFWMMDYFDEASRVALCFTSKRQYNFIRNSEQCPISFKMSNSFFFENIMNDKIMKIYSQNADIFCKLFTVGLFRNYCSCRDYCIICASCNLFKQITYPSNYNFDFHSQKNEMTLDDYNNYLKDREKNLKMKSSWPWLDIIGISSVRRSYEIPRRIIIIPWESRYQEEITVQPRNTFQFNAARQQMGIEEIGHPISRITFMETEIKKRIRQLKINKKKSIEENREFYKKNKYDVHYSDKQHSKQYQREKNYKKDNSCNRQYCKRSR